MATQTSKPLSAVELAWAALSDAFTTGDPAIIATAQAALDTAQRERDASRSNGREMHACAWAALDGACGASFRSETGARQHRGKVVDGVYRKCEPGSRAMTASIFQKRRDRA